MLPYAIGKQPPLTGPERNATWQLPTARNSGAANTAYPVGPGSIAFLSEPVKGVPLRGGRRLPLAQNLRAAFWTFSGAGPSTIMHEAPFILPFAAAAPRRCAPISTPTSGGSGQCPDLIRRHRAVRRGRGAGCAADRLAGRPGHLGLLCAAGCQLCGDVCPRKEIEILALFSIRRGGGAFLRLRLCYREKKYGSKAANRLITVRGG